MGLISPSVLSTERSGSLETRGAGAQAAKGQPSSAFSRSDSRGPDTHGRGPLPLLQPRRSVWVQGKSAPPGKGLKPSSAKPCPGRPRGFYGEPDDTGNPVPVPGSARPQGQVVMGWTRAPLSFLLGGTPHPSSERCNPTRSVPEKTGRCSVYIECSLLPNTETSTFRGTQPLGMRSSVTSTYFLDQRLGTRSCKLGNEKLMVSIL